MRLSRSLGLRFILSIAENLTSGFDSVRTTAIFTIPSIPLKSIPCRFIWNMKRSIILSLFAASSVTFIPGKRASQIPSSVILITIFLKQDSFMLASISVRILVVDRSSSNPPLTALLKSLIVLSSNFMLSRCSSLTPLKTLEGSSTKLRLCRTFSNLSFKSARPPKLSVRVPQSSSLREIDIALTVKSRRPKS